MALGCAAATQARAESFFQLEAGAGVQVSRDGGDNLWVQYGLAHKENLTTPAWMIGVTGDVTDWLSWHADFVDLGHVSASTMAVGDDQYDVGVHRVRPQYRNVPLTRFEGNGHTYGVALTLEPHYTWHDIRFGVEAGPFIYRTTWNETIYNLGGPPSTLGPKPEIMVKYVVGANVSYKNVGLSYRYYANKTKWNPVPGIVTGTHAVMLTIKTNAVF